MCAASSAETGSMSAIGIFRQLRRCHSSHGFRDVKQDERHHSRAEGGSIFLSGKSLQQSNANLTSVEVYVPVSSTLKQQRCKSLGFWKFVSLHPICKIESTSGPSPSSLFDSTRVTTASRSCEELSDSVLNLKRCPTLISDCI